MAALLDRLAELKDAALESDREAGAGDVDVAGLQRQPPITCSTGKCV